MKKLRLAMIIVWSIIAIIIIGILISGITFPGGIIGIRGGNSLGTRFVSKRSGNETVYMDQSVPVSGLERVALTLSSDDCDIYPSSDDQIRVIQYGINLSDSQIISIKQYDSTLEIARGAGHTIWFGYSKSRVEVYLPGAYHNDLEARLASGKIRIQTDLDLERLSIQLSSGDIASDRQISAGEVDLTVTSGDVRLAALKTEQYDCTVSSGELDIRELTGSGDLSATSGTIRADNVTIAERLDVQVSSGDVNLSLAGDPGLNFTGKRSSGDIHTYFDVVTGGTNDKAVSATIGAEPRKDLSVQVTSGTVRIDR